MTARFPLSRITFTRLTGQCFRIGRELEFARRHDLPQGIVNMLADTILEIESTLEKHRKSLMQADVVNDR